MPKKTILKGISASTGVVKGNAKLILDSSQCSKLKKGEILVTEMTDPLFLPAIQKASAIITDIGGLLCHAAIISREFGIPCITNTKNATKVLKDNQKVEVDAIKGEVYESK